MKKILFYILLFLSICSCADRESEKLNEVNWKDRSTGQSLPDTLSSGQTYLSVYSQIYSETEHKTHPLTATISIRNINTLDTVYILKADYFNTTGKLIRTTINQPVFLLPMETVEIVIAQADLEGGSGGNFMFSWAMPTGSCEPFFECVMISTYGQQGLSFTTTGQVVSRKSP